MKRNNKTYSTKKKYNSKENGELRQPKSKKLNRNSYRYNEDYDEIPVKEWTLTDDDYVIDIHTEL